MLTFLGSNDRSRDPISRRGFLRVGALGLGGLTLADLLRLRAQGAAHPKASVKSIIMVYLHGGPSHIDMYDMKPGAPAEFRGQFNPIQTNVSGFDICELMPLQARIADKMSLIRNMSFMEYIEGHNPPLLLTGYPNTLQKQSHRPTFGSVVSKLRGGAVPAMPPYVAFDGFCDDPVRAADYLGVAHRPFVPGGEQMNSLSPVAGVTLDRMSDRRELLRSFDTLRRDIDGAHGNMEGMEAFTARALDIVTTPKARDAFDVTKEPAMVRALYAGGTQFLQARRLVEAGVQVVTLTANAESKTWDLAGPWDHHGKIFPALRQLLPELDQRLYALITDLYARGLDQDVAVLVWGEMGRTPRVNAGAGRDHWNDVGFALVAGGGLKMGQVIGATTAQGDRATGRPYTPQNMLATLYHQVLGIDPVTTIPDLNGRPVYLLDDREKIPELV
ncbi:MAG TPA: DUF1501 domain-containing protein [Pirellulales bacterium]|nr:DUF1501 domain-containing protein [Pirellulales bacterium]